MRQFAKVLVLCGVALLLMASSPRAQSLSVKGQVTLTGDLRVSLSESGLKNEVGEAIGYRITGYGACAASGGAVAVETVFSLTVSGSGHTSAVIGVEEPLACDGAGKSVVYSDMQLCDTTHTVCKAF